MKLVKKAGKTKLVISKNEWKKIAQELNNGIIRKSFIVSGFPIQSSREIKRLLSELILMSHVRYNSPIHEESKIKIIEKVLRKDSTTPDEYFFKERDPEDNSVLLDEEYLNSVDRLGRSASFEYLFTIEGPKKEVEFAIQRIKEESMLLYEQSVLYFKFI